MQLISARSRDRPARPARPQTIATAAGPVGPAQRAMMAAAQKVILHTNVDIDGLSPVTPAELAKGFAASPEIRHQFAHGMIVTAVADGTPAREAIAQLDAYAKALVISDPVLADLRLLADGYLTIFKLDFLRRGHIKDIFKNQLEQKGALALAKSVLTMRGVMEDPALAARYRAWEKLPEGSLGRSLVDFYNKNGFSVPGERGGFPEAGLSSTTSASLHGGLQHRAGGRAPGRRVLRGLQARAALLLMWFSIPDLQRACRCADRRTSCQGRARQPGIAELVLAAVERGSR